MSNLTALDEIPLGNPKYLGGWFVRLLRKSTLNPGGCWVWNGWTNHKGYGQTSYNPRKGHCMAESDREGGRLA